MKPALRVYAPLSITKVLGARACWSCFEVRGAICERKVKVKRTEKIQDISYLRNVMLWIQVQLGAVIATKCLKTDLLASKSESN